MSPNIYFILFSAFSFSEINKELLFKNEKKKVLNDKGHVEAKVSGFSVFKLQDSFF